jgi:hypothetical protein
MTRNRLSAHQTHGGQTVSVTVPASMLGAGQYELTLKGMNDQGTLEDVGYYYFDVRKK